MLSITLSFRVMILDVALPNIFLFSLFLFFLFMEIDYWLSFIHQGSRLMGALTSSHLHLHSEK